MTTDVQTIIRANTSRRSAKLSELQAWVDGEQYAGRPKWLDDASDKPLWEREPCVQYPAARIAIASNTDLVLGEGRAPTFTTRPEEEDQIEDGALAMSEEECGLVDGLMVEIERVSRLRTVDREGFALAQSVGTVVRVQGVRNGLPYSETYRAQWCEREVDVLGEVTALEIRYPYVREWKDQGGQWQREVMLYRRRIDQWSDTTYLPARAQESGVEPQWIPDPARTLIHGLGWCPVVWYAHMRGCAGVDVIDGRALHAEACDEIRAHDFALSQWHRAALYAGDPQWTECGVEAGYSPTEQGRPAMLPATPEGGLASAKNPVTGGYRLGGPPGDGRRKKGPGIVWQYAAPDTKVELHTLPPGALDAIADNARDIKTKLQETLGVVLLDPEGVKFASTTSGKALAALKQRQIDRCDQYRDDVRDGMLVPVRLQLLRLVAQLDGVRVRGAVKARAVLRRFLRVVPGEVAVGPGGTAYREPGVPAPDRVEWSPPSLTAQWGPYFRSAPEDELAIVGVAKTAHDAGLITRRTAVEKVARLFGIEGVEAYVAMLEEEAAAKMKRSADLMHSLTGGDDSEDDDAPPSKPGAEGKPPPMGAPPDDDDAA